MNLKQGRGERVMKRKRPPMPSSERNGKVDSDGHHSMILQKYLFYIFTN